MIEAVKRNFVEVNRIYGGEVTPIMLSTRHIVSFYPEPNGTKGQSLINLSDKTCILVKHSYHDLQDLLADLYQYKES